MLKADQVLVGKNLTRVHYNDRIRDLKGLPSREPVPGDRLVCLRNNRQKKLLNGQLWTVVEVRRKDTVLIDLLLDPEDTGDPTPQREVSTHEWFFQGRDGEFSWAERRAYDEFYFGYALTVHKSQGSQWENVYLFDESAVFREHRDRHLYTAVTRAAERITIVSGAAA